MKKILLAVLVLAATAGSAFAQTNNDNNASQAQSSRDDRKDQMRPPYNPFEDLNLTAEQQTKIDALRAERKAEFEKAKADKQKAKADKKADKQKAKENVRAKMKAEREQMLAKIKGILTTDQYIKFLENNFVNGAKQGPRPDKGFKGPRGDRKHDGKAPMRDGKKMKRDK